MSHVDQEGRLFLLLIEYGAESVAWVLFRDLSVNERPTNGQREGGDLLQPLLSVGATLRRRAATLPGHEAHYGSHRRRTTQQARP